MEESRILNKLDEMSQNINERFDKLEGRFDGLETDVRDIKLTIENELRKNISIIAEGHGILNRKLDEIIKQNEDRQFEREWIKLKINHLDSEMIKVKQRIGID